MHPPTRDLAALARLYKLDSNAEWQALLTCVDYAEAFTFLVLLVPDAAGAELCRTQLIEKLAESGRVLQDRSPRKTEDWGRVLEGLVRQRVDGAAAVVWVEAAVTERDPNFDAWRESWRLAGSRINPFRNMLESSLGCVLIFVGCEWMKPVLRESAPDLWSVRSSVIEIRPAVTDERQNGGLERMPQDLPVSRNAPDPELALRQVESLRGRQGQELALARALARAGDGLAERFEWQDAIPLLRESLDLRRQFSASAAEVMNSLQSLGLNLYRTGQLTEAHVLLEDCEQLSRKVGDKFHLSGSLRVRSWILADWGRLREAMGFLVEQEEICRTLDDRIGLQRNLGNQALIQRAWGRLDVAMALFKEQEDICRKVADESGLQRSLGNQALILRDWSQLDDAMVLLQEQESICRKLGDKAGLHRSLGNQAEILKDWGRLDEAMSLQREKERICRKLGDKSELNKSLGNQAAILTNWGRLEDAMTLYKEAELGFRELEDCTHRFSSLRSWVVLATLSRT